MCERKKYLGLQGYILYEVGREVTTMKFSGHNNVLAFKVDLRLQVLLA